MGKSNNKVGKYTNYISKFDQNPKKFGKTILNDEHMKNAWSCSSLNDKQRVATRWRLSTNQLGSTLQLYRHFWLVKFPFFPIIHPTKSWKNFPEVSFPPVLGWSRAYQAREYNGIFQRKKGESQKCGGGIYSRWTLNWKMLKSHPENLAVCPSKLVVGRLRTFLPFKMVPFQGHLFIFGG